jgi:hypothetical protein
MRTHIAKSLQKRCRAIRNAVQKYNVAARELNPPRPTLDWTTVTHYSFLEEFTLLRETRQDIRKQPWARPVVRETIRQHLRIQRAQEELIRCIIETRRLESAITQEHETFDCVLGELKAAESPLYSVVSEFCHRRGQLNASLMQRVAQILDLHAAQHPDAVRDHTDGLDGMEEVGEEADGDHVNENMEVLVNYISELS